MTLIRWNPWNLPSLIDDDWLNLPTIPGLSRITGQGLNIYETENEIVAEAAMPGISENNIDITVEEGIVTIHGAVEDKHEDKGQRRYFMSSMASIYDYSFKLPESVISGKEPGCELDSGVLKLSFEKVKKTPPKKIQIKAKSK